MGETQSKPATIDAGPITVKPAVQTNIEPPVTPDESPQVGGEMPLKLQPGYRFKVPSVELCAMDSGLAPPVFAQLQQLFWAYDDSIYERQSLLSRNMQRIDSHLSQCQKIASHHDSKASLCVFDRTLPAMKQNVNEIQDKLHSLEESVGKLSFIVAKLMTLRLPPNEVKATSTPPPSSSTQSPTDTDNIHADKTPTPNERDEGSAMETTSLDSSLVSITQTAYPHTGTSMPVTAPECDSCAETPSSSSLSPHTNGDVAEDAGRVQEANMEEGRSEDNPTREGTSIGVSIGLSAKDGKKEEEGREEGTGRRDRTEEAEREVGTVPVQEGGDANASELVYDTAICYGDKDAGQDTPESSINT